MSEERTTRLDNISGGRQVGCRHATNSGRKERLPVVELVAVLALAKHVLPKMR